MRNFNWLHLSDVHFKREDKYDKRYLLKTLLEFLSTGKLLKQFNPLDAIFFTGDIAFSGKAAEYAQADAFFEKLLDVTRVERERLFIVPGNHDVDRDAVAKGLRFKIDNEEACDEVFENPSVIEFLQERFRHYRAFAAKYPGAVLTEGNPFLSAVFSVGGRRIGVVGLNSGWLCINDNDHGKLVIGRALLRNALTRVQTAAADIVFAMMHHPTACLEKFERDHILSLLADEHRGADVILSGHMHKPSASKIDNGAGVQAVRFPAGALYENARVAKTCMLGRWEIDENRFNIAPLVFDATAARARGQWHVDHKLTSEENDYLAKFDRRRKTDAKDAGVAEPGKVNVIMKHEVRTVKDGAAMPVAVLWIEPEEALGSIERVEYECVKGQHANHKWHNSLRDEKFCQTFTVSDKVTVRATVFLKGGVEGQRQGEVELVPCREDSRSAGHLRSPST